MTSASSTDAPAVAAVGQPPLWQQLQAAAATVRRVRAGHSLSELLPQQPAALRAGVQALTFHTLRWLGLAEGLRSLLVQRRPPAAADALLCVALAVLAEPGPAYEAFTLIHQAVEAANRDADMQPQARLINACLRRFTREWRMLRRMLRSQGHVVAAFNHPMWWVRRMKGDHPNSWQSVLQEAQRTPPMVLRVNVQRISVEDFMAELARASLPAMALGGAAVRLELPCPVHRIPGFAKGWCSVQSLTAQRAAPLLLGALPESCEAPRVLDACAAPGGKTAHMLELRPDARMTAIDIDATRLGMVRENMQRLGLHADVLCADASCPQDWWDGQMFDAIMLDAPCSASGVTSRHPDVRWLRRESDIAHMAERQDALLHALWPLLRAGGALLYVTCSAFRQEGSERIKAFVASHADAQHLRSPGYVLPKTPRPDMPPPRAAGDNAAPPPPDDDGFFFALLRKGAVPQPAS